MVKEHLSEIWILGHDLNRSLRVDDPALLKEMYLDHQAGRRERRRRMEFLRDVEAR